MGETVKAEKTPKKGWVTGTKSEFKKIIWPDKKSLGKQTAAVVALSVVIGIVITIVDFIVQNGIDLLMLIK